MKRLLLCALVVASIAVPGRGHADSVRHDASSIDESGKPMVLAERPRTSRKWEQIDPSVLGNIVAAANTNKIFLNRCAGGCTVTPGSTDSRSNRSTIPDQTSQLSAFSRGDAVWNNVVACMKDVFTPFGVEILTTDPGSSVNHFEIMIAGTPQQLQLGSGTGGISPFNCQAQYIPNSLVFVFDVWGNSIEDICATAAQEIAHSFRLDHVIEPSDPLTYFNFNGRKRFKDAELQCGSDCVNGRGPFGQTCSGANGQSHTCTCTGLNTQNSVSVLKALFGTGTPTPPDLTITKPKTGDNVMPGFPVAVEATDVNGIGMVELRVNSMLTASITQFPYVFNAPTTLTDGTHNVEVTAYDEFGASTKKTVQVVIGKPCGKPADCPLDTDTCIGGRCVPGPGVQGGLGTVCVDNTSCASGQCAADNKGNRFCVDSCELGEGQCPDGFGCLEAGENNGVCWPGHDDGSGGGCSTGSGGALAIGLSFLALVIARRRPRK
ncbi:MAG: Ig-like domain-containing protein [Deltaproteobacteria bacterium]|nr:Ig-like domain-containing protein [Deltaproteobacteria bacterium]